MQPPGTSARLIVLCYRYREKSYAAAGPALLACMHDIFQCIRVYCTSLSLSREWRSHCCALFVLVNTADV